MKRRAVGSQGEVNAFEIDSIPDGLVPMNDKTEAGDFIVGHSENGNHHIVENNSGTKILQRPKGAEMDKALKSGMNIMWAVFDNPTVLKQDTNEPHKPIPLGRGLYEFRISREQNPFSKQAQRVAD